MVVTSVYLLASYGSSLFVGTPVLMGTTAAYVYNRSGPRSFLASAGVGAASVLAGSAAMLLFAAEGVICLMMALPLAMPIAALGGVLGKAIADASRSPVGLAGALVMLQGIAEIVRCIRCLKTGVWPERLSDVEEIDVVEEQLAHSEYVDEESRRTAIEQAHHIDEAAKTRTQDKL